jgi:2-oxo-3-hexenedioate decarboxylase
VIAADGGTASLSVAKMVAPRIEPEIAFRLSAPVPAGCDDPVQVLESVEWAARAFEVVDCHYDGWKFAGPDSVIDFAHHAALIVGEPIEVDGGDVEALRDCRVTLLRDGELVDSGAGVNALGHPLLALAHLADVIASQPGAPPLAAGEVVTTGTLTAAMPVKAGETWRTETEGLGFAPLSLHFE